MSPLRLPRVIVLVALLAVAVVAAAGDGLGDRLQYLYRELDRGALDLRVAFTMAQDPYPETRREVAQTLASLADPELLPMLELYLRDHDPLVREQIMLAAGRIGPAAVALIRAGVLDGSVTVRQAAMWAACHGGEDAVVLVRQRLADETNTTVLETALGNLWRLGDGRWEDLAAGFATAAEPRLRRAAAAGLARSGDPRRVVPLVRLVSDPEPVIRVTAIGGLRAGPAPDDLGELLAVTLGDQDWRVQAAVCGVLAARPQLALGAAPAAVVAGLWHSEWPHLAVAALRAAAARPALGDDADLVHLTAAAEPWLAAEALLALAQRGAERAPLIAAEWAAAEPVWQRAAAARAGRWLAAPVAARIAEQVRRDPVAAVRLAWLDEADPASLELHALATSDPDPVVRAAALDAWLGAAGPAVEELLDLARRWHDDAAGDARATALAGALRAAPADCRAAILALGLGDADPAVVAQVVAAARELGLAAAAPPRPARHDDAWYRELVTWRETTRWLDLVTVRGTVRIRLDATDAPLSARTIFDLAAAGFYDGLTIHRVVPNFVVQGGDPRGDGWGGPGFVLPDEPSGVPFDSWRVGIATAGPNTGGSQLFVTLLPADRLTGHYTNLGEVVRGREVLVRLQVGDAIVRAEVASGAEPPPPTPVLTGEVEWPRLAALDGWGPAPDQPPLDETALAVLRDHAAELRLVVVLGTWCSDSQRELGRLERVLVAVPDLAVRMVGVDRTKRLPLDDPDAALFAGSAPAAVPTMVLETADGRELGRVVEQAADAWERLLAALVPVDPAP